MKEQYEKDLIEILNKVEPKKWYQNTIFQRRGHQNSITSLYAKLLLDNINNINCIKAHPRKNGYKTNHLRDNITFSSASNRRENNIARLLFKNRTKIKRLGEVIDYEIPLTAGTKQNIDLLCKNDKFLNIIELKSDKSKESILKAILEIYTYEQLLNKEEWEKYISGVIDNQNLKDQLEIKKCIMLFEGTVPTNTITEDVEKLLEKLKISVFIYDNEVPDKIDENVEFKPKILRYQIY